MNHPLKQREAALSSAVESRRRGGREYKLTWRDLGDQVKLSGSEIPIILGPSSISMGHRIYSTAPLFYDPLAITVKRHIGGHKGSNVSLLRLQRLKILT